MTEGATSGNGSTSTMRVSHHDAAVQSLRKSRGLRRDAWFNSRNKFGGTADPVIITEYVRSRGRMARAEAETLFEFDWLSRRVVEQQAKDATREWVNFTHKTDPAKAEALREEDERLGGQELFREAIRLGRLHGGNVLVLGVWDGRTAPEEPLEIEKTQHMAFAHNVDRWLTFPRTWYRDVEDPKYGSPETYLVHRLAPIGTAPSTVHETRVIRFDGNPLPPLARVRNWGWGASVLDEVYDALRNWGIANQAAASIVPNFITYAMKISNLQALIANGDWATIQNRMGEAWAQMSIQNMMAYGADEQIEKMGTNIAGLPDLIDRFMKIVSGAVNIPMSILFQAESGALGGNSANTDQDNWYNDVGSYQNTYLRMRCRRWFDIIGVPIGLKPGEVEFDFKPLREMSPQQEADLYQKISQADQTYVNSGIIDTPERLGVFRFGGAKFNPGMPVFDTARMEAIAEEVDKLPVELGEGEAHGIPDGEEEEEGGGPPQQDDEGILAKVRNLVDSMFRDREPAPAAPRKMKVITTRREDGSLEAIVEENPDGPQD